MKKDVGSSKRKMTKKIEELARTYFPEAVSLRRLLHEKPELGWCEYVATSVVAAQLKALGYQVQTGPSVCKADARMGVPSEEILEREWLRARSEGIPERELEPMRGGFTGLVAVLHQGPGPVAALRLDLDALPLTEKTGLPFASSHPGVMHACGHDGHTAMGVGIARIMKAMGDQWQGTLKLIFQPAEEGVRGGRAVAEAGHVDDVDFLLGAHIFGRSRPEGDCDLVPGASGSFATTKLDAEFTGRAAHAGSFPEKGLSVMPAMAAAVTALYGIPRHSKGATRINVGRMEAGGGRNVVADHGILELEIRGAGTEINSYMEEQARRILLGAAEMHGVSCRIQTAGGAPSVVSSLPLCERIRTLCLEQFPQIRPTSYLQGPSEGSEDFSWLMERVKARGGQAAFPLLLTDTAAPGHTPEFDFPETVLHTGMTVLSGVLFDILKK